MHEIRSDRASAGMKSTALYGTFLLCLLAFAILVTPREAAAQIGSARYSSMVIDAGSGAVLSAVNPDAPRYPASLTKLMTLYMVFEGVRDRRISLDSPVPVSAAVAGTPPSKLGLLPGTRLTVEQAVLGLVTKSANDAAAALGEMLGGSEPRFAQMMTLRARALGMTHTSFRNASGLPDPEQISTARDLALLARHLVQDFPEQYHYFSVASFTFHGQLIPNHDHLLVDYPGADGMKTGYTQAAGHNLVSSAVRGNVRLIGVVLGAGSNIERDRHMMALLDDGFARLDVPTAPRPDTSLIARLPSLTTSAQAATLPHRRRYGVQPVAQSAMAGHLALRWSVQIGSFRSQATARQAATAAKRRAHAGEIRLLPVFIHRRENWRAQLVGLTQAEAQNACAGAKGACMLIRPQTRQLASR